MLLHVQVRRDGYLDATQTRCGLRSEDVDAVVDPTSARLPAMVAGLDCPAVCVGCATTKGRVE